MSTAEPSVLPQGIVTFLLTDVEGSTALWESHRDVMAEVMTSQRALIRTRVERHNGALPLDQGEGDSVLAAFAQASDAVSCAIDIQLALAGAHWPRGVTVKVRCGLHAGDAEVRDGNYLGPPVNRCARLRSIAHGGQTVVSETVRMLLDDRPPDGCWFADLGLHALRGTSRPEQVWQLCHEGLPTDFPPLLSTSVQHNIGARVTSLLGRDDDLDRVVGLLATSRLVTITGAGGCGKTSLAVEVASELIGLRDGGSPVVDGAWIVELAGVRDAALVLAQIAAAMGVRDEQGGAGRSRVVTYLSGRRALVVVDNCEHLLGAAASEISELLRALPDLRVVATSRESLRIEGEHVYVLDPLPAPSTGDWPVDNAAVRLFCERARAVNPAFELTQANVDAVVEICRRLDGLPLAIELAGARTRSLTPRDIATRLDSRFTVLGRSRSSLPHHQTLRSAIEWSIDLLSDAERAAFRRLSVFAASFPLDAAERVLAAGDVAIDDVPDIIDSLTSKSLLVVAEVHGQMRYRVLEPIREYAQELLAGTPDEPDAAARLVSWARDLCRTESKGRALIDWLDACELERENLREAFRRACVLGEIDAAWTLLDGAHRMLLKRGFWAEARRMLDQAIQSALFSEERVVELILRRGAVASMLDAREDQERLFAEARRRAALSQEPRVALAVDRGLTLRQMERGEYAAAAETAERVLFRALAYGEPSDIADALEIAANVEAVRDGADLERAENLMSESHRIYESLDDLEETAVTLFGRGLIAYYREDHATARAWHAAALDLFRAIGHKAQIAHTALNLGIVTWLCGDAVEAHRLGVEALSLSAELRESAMVLECIEAAGALATLEAHLESGATLFGWTIAERLARGTPPSPSDSKLLDLVVNLARSSMTEQEWERLLAIGAALSLDESVDLGLRIFRGDVMA